MADLALSAEREKHSNHKYIFLHNYQYNFRDSKTSDLSSDDIPQPLNYLLVRLGDPILQNHIPIDTYGSETNGQSYDPQVATLHTLILSIHLLHRYHVEIPQQLSQLPLDHDPSIYNEHHLLEALTQKPKTCLYIAEVCMYCIYQAALKLRSANSVALHVDDIIHSASDLVVPIAISPGTIPTEIQSWRMYSSTY